MCSVFENAISTMQIPAAFCFREKNAFRRPGLPVRLCCRRSAARTGGFSLVEITMAIGIVAFAFVAVLGLLPAGLNTFHRAMDASVTGQIFQRVVSEAQQTDFNVLVSDATPNVTFFDDQGNYLGKEGSISDEDKRKSIYHVKMRIEPMTTLPGSSTQNTDLATVTVQIANNPGNIILQLDATAGSPFYNLWRTNQGVMMVTQSTMVARNTSIQSQD